MSGWRVSAITALLALLVCSVAGKAIAKPSPHALVAVTLICDDANDGAESLGAKYYIVVWPGDRWRKADLALYSVGNRIALRRQSVDLASNTQVNPLSTLMDQRTWSVAYAPHEGC